MENYNIEHVIMRIGKVLVAMLLLGMSVMKMVYRMIFHSDNKEISAVGLILFVVAIWIAWMMMPMFFIGLMAGIIFTGLIIAVKEL